MRMGLRDGEQVPPGASIFGNTAPTGRPPIMPVRDRNAG